MKTLQCLSQSAIILTSAFLISCSTASKTNIKQDHKTYNIVWTLKDVSIQNPESAYYEPDTRQLFISNVAGGPTEKDHKGWISKVDPKTGKIISGKWAQGLSAPKGMRSYHGVLWVSDIDQVVAIDLKTGKIKKKFPIKGAKFLNDVAIGPEGEVFVSDMITGVIHTISKNKASVFVKDQEKELPNGLLVVDRTLYVTSWGIGMKPDFSTEEPGRLIAYDLETKSKTLVSMKGFGNLDGLETDGAGNFYVSDWVAGKIYFVNARGEPTLMLQDKSGTADLGFIQASKLLIVPQMNDHSITAYAM